MSRSWVLIVAASSTLFVVAVLVGHFRADPSTQVAGVAVEMARGAPGATAGQSGSPVGWIAKAGPGTEQQGARGLAALGGASSSAEHGSDSHTAVGDTGGSATMMYGDSGTGSSIESGPGAGAADAVNVQASVPAAALPSDVSKSLAGGNAPAGGQQQQVAQAASNQQPATGSDPSKSDNPDEQGPVLSIPFDNNPLPDKGDTAPIAEEGVTFDGQGATFSTDSQFAIPDAGNLGTAESGTISFCLRPQWGGDDTSTDASLVNLHTNTFENRVQIAKNGPFLRFLMADNTGHESGASLATTGWQAGQNHLVTATWGQALSSLYVDAQLAGSQTYPGDVQIPPGTPMYIGSDVPGGNPGARASLSNFQVYDRALSPDEVANLASGCQ